MKKAAEAEKMAAEAERTAARLNTFAVAWNWVDAYLQLQHGADSAYYRFLRQAMAARRALLLLDGLDEGGARRAEIEAHVTGVLTRKAQASYGTAPLAKAEAMVRRVTVVIT